MTWLVTGGAGFIGGHVTHALLREGKDVVVLDDLSTGHRSSLASGAEFREGSLLERHVVDDAMSVRGLEGVVHIAGYKFAGESVERPLHTYEQNVVGMWNLLDSMRSHAVRNIIFSSSAAVYGDVDVGVIDEHQPTNPKSPYSESKLVGEWMLRDLALSDGFRHTSLRYFNVVGSREGGIGDQSPHSFLSLVFGAITRGARPQIFGDDYSTDDGTCVRDYIPVGELADCHVAAAHLLSSGQPLETAYNIGTGTGHSVAAVMGAVQRVTGIAFEPEILPRREGDPAMVVASGELAKRDLGWSPSGDLENMIRSAWDDYRSRGES